MDVLSKEARQKRIRCQMRGRKGRGKRARIPGDWGGWEGDREMTGDQRNGMGADPLAAKGGCLN